MDREVAAETLRTIDALRQRSEHVRADKSLAPLLWALLPVGMVAGFLDERLSAIAVTAIAIFAGVFVWRRHARAGVRLKSTQKRSSVGGIVFLCVMLVFFGPVIFAVVFGWLLVLPLVGRTDPTFVALWIAGVGAIVLGVRTRNEYLAPPAILAIILLMMGSVTPVAIHSAAEASPTITHLQLSRIGDELLMYSTPFLVVAAIASVAGRLGRRRVA